MVGHGVVYGILLTDEFGYAKHKELVSTIKSRFNVFHKGYPTWIYSFPSAEYDQLALGVGVNLDKNTDFSQVHAQWEELMKTIPEEITELLKQYSLPEPNVHVLSGYY